jgi:hypothetical protein
LDLPKVKTPADRAHGVIDTRKPLQEEEEEMVLNAASTHKDRRQNSRKLIIRIKHKK